MYAAGGGGKTSGCRLYRGRSGDEPGGYIWMDVEDKLKALRKLMQERNLAAYIIPTDDFHGSEYVGEYFKAREYMSGFTGSAGTLIVLSDEAALWTDGRYFIQAAKQLAGTSIKLMRAGQPGVPTIEEYLCDRLEEKSVIGFDGRTVTGRFAEKIAEKTAAKQITFAGDEDLVDSVWAERPPISEEPVWELDVQYAGKSREEKLEAVREKMREKEADVLLLTALDEIAWLLNLRGNDVKYTPVFLAYMLVTQNESLLCVHEKILSDEIREKLEQADVRIEPYDAIGMILRNMPKEKRVWIDRGSVNYSLLHSLPEEITKIDECSPIMLMKAVKTPQEMEHIRNAHIKDGVAVTRFIRWLKTNVNDGKITEMSASRKLESFRSQMEGYLGASFEPIIAYGAHGAIVHYEPTEQTDVEIKSGGLCLADTGGHYREGTTDVTRTVALGTVSEEEKDIIRLRCADIWHLALQGLCMVCVDRIWMCWREGRCGRRDLIIITEPDMAWDFFSVCMKDRSGFTGGSHRMHRVLCWKKEW